MAWLSGRLLDGTLAGVVGLALAISGCGATCDRNPDDPPVIYRGGTTENGVYRSSDWEGPLLDFPAGRTYRLMHELGARPLDIDVWLSFSDNGVKDSNIAPGAGNQGVIEAVTDEYIDIRNDTCADGGWLLVVASEPEGP